MKKTRFFPFFHKGKIEKIYVFFFNFPEGKNPFFSLSLKIYIFHIYIFSSLVRSQGKKSCVSCRTTTPSLTVTNAKFLRGDVHLEFFMPMMPPTVTHQEKKITKRGSKTIVYEPMELKDARSKLLAHLARHRPDKPYTGAVRLVTKWCFLPVGEHEHGEWKTTKPDTDNMIKLLKDCMAKEGFFINDAIVASEVTEKFWADPPGIFVGIYEL